MQEIRHGDCLAVMREMQDASVDAVVTDPPYGLSFMGKKWDYDVPSEDVWRECLRVLKPGGHLLAFAGTRTQHRMACRIEDAGFEIRDMIAWVYGSGFPKSLDVSKAIDKAAGVEREVVGPNPNGRPNMVRVEASVLAPRVDAPLTAPATEAARQWQGWGTALKPALEPITMARKPLAGTVAANVLEHGTGAINVDGCRVGTEATITVRNGNSGAHGRYGRWPANLIHDGSEEVVRLLNDAARFFYCAKASAKDRDEGVAGVAGVAGGMSGRRDGTMGSITMRKNTHPTVKPTDLMRYLCRLVTPLGGTVLDPFAGSGSTGKAAALEGFRFIGIEREAEYVEIARARIAAAVERAGLFERTAS
jgi:site-specific DNA-methyltransferase (adenine-specific)